MQIKILCRRLNMFEKSCICIAEEQMIGFDLQKLISSSFIIVSVFPSLSPKSDVYTYNTVKSRTLILLTCTPKANSSYGTATFTGSLYDIEIAELLMTSSSS